MEKENRRLQKSPEETVIKKKEKHDSGNWCPDCAKGQLSNVFINAGSIERIETCPVCEYRKVHRYEKSKQTEEKAGGTEDEGS